MATAQVTHHCGHTVQIPAKNQRDADSKSAYLQARDGHLLCWNCQRDQTNALAAGLPTLTGTEKQIAWGTTIRQDFLQRGMPIVAQEARDGLLEDLGEVGTNVIIEEARSYAMEHSEARWWIDHQEILRQALVAAMYLDTIMCTGRGHMAVYQDLHPRIQAVGQPYGYPPPVDEGM